jgi:hypothetical protein
VAAQNHLQRSRLSDVEFLYPPSQIAAACFRLADGNLVDTTLRTLIPSLDDHADDVKQNDSSSSASNGLLAQQELTNVLKSIQQEIQSVPADGSFDKKKVKAIDKVVKTAQDPMRNKTSALLVLINTRSTLTVQADRYLTRYRREEDEREAKQAAKRARRLKRAKQDTENRDAFFGDAIGAKPEVQGRALDNSSRGLRGSMKDDGDDDLSMDSDSSDSD